MKHRLPLLVFAVGLIALVAAASFAVTRGPFDRSPCGNESVYWDAAQKAAKGQADAAFLSAYPSPLYVRLLGALAGDGVTAARDARRVLTPIGLALTGALVFALARRRAGPWAAVAAGWAAVIAAPVVLSAGAFSPALPAALLCGFALVALDGRRNPVSWAVAGALVGLSGQFNGPLAWVVGVLLAVFAVLRPREAVGRRGWLPSVAAFALLWVAASWGGATIVGSRSALPPLQGVDVYRGHRALASGVEPRRGDSDAMRWWMRRDYTREASRLLERRVSSSEAGAYWARRAAGEALRHPLAELRRTGVKVMATYQGDPLPRDVSPRFLVERGDTGLLPVSIWLGRILLPLGLAGFLVARRRAGWVPWVAVLSGLGVALLTYAEADARDLSVLGLAVGVALFVDRMATLRGGARLRTAAIGVAAIALFGLVPAFAGLPGQKIQSDDHYQLGAVYDFESRGSAAMREYERASRLDPANPFPRFAIAGMLARDNVLEEATRELEALRERNPEFVPGLAALARLYERTQRWPEASSAYGDLVRLDPGNPEYLNNLGTLYVQMGLYDQALSALQSALAIDPNYEAAQVNLAALRERGLAPGGEASTDPLRAAQERVLNFVRMGDAAAADSVLQEAYARFGRNTPDLVFVEGTLRLVTGHPEQAVPLFESVRQAFSGNTIFLNNFAAAYAGSGKLAEAAAVWEEALKVQPTNQQIRRSLATVRAQMDSLGIAPGK